MKRYTNKGHHLKGFSSICVNCRCEAAALGSDPVCRPHVQSPTRDGCQVCNASGLQVLQGVPCTETWQSNQPTALPATAAGRLGLIQDLLSPPKGEDGSQPAPLISKEEAQAMVGAFQGNGTNVMGGFAGIDRSVAPPQKLADDGAKSIQEAMLDAIGRMERDPGPPLYICSPAEYREMQECGPGIATKDLTPKAPDYSAWADDDHLIPDAEG